MPPVSKIVQIQRRSPLDSLIGVLLWEGPEIIIASEISDSLDPDGYCFLPKTDILQIEDDFKHLDFYAAAASVWENVVLDSSAIDHQGTYVELMQSMSREKSLIAVHVEVSDPDIAYVGKVRRVLSDRIGFTNLSQHGIWISETQTFKIQQITKIEISTRYLRSLNGVVAARRLADSAGTG